jgi:CSLREA domain-containing protein
VRALEFIVVALLAVVAMPASVSAGQVVSFTVTKTADTNDGHCNSDCSLREAITAANASPVSADVDIVTPGTYKLTRKGRNENMNATGDLDIRARMRIQGAGARNVIIDGNGIDRVFDIPDQSTIDFAVFIQDVSIKGGLVKNGPGGGVSVFDAHAFVHLVGTSIRSNSAQFGGGIVVWHDTTTYVDYSTVSGNHATGGNGGGIDNGGDLYVTNSTISGNHATSGAGIEAEFGTTTISYSTIAFNVASSSAGGIDAIVGSAVATGSIVAKNLVGTVASNCSATIGDGGHNLENGTSCGLVDSTDLNGNPKLAALGDYGGPTNTHKPMKGSPAINHGGTSGFPPYDQRGVDRPRGSQADIGSFEK